MTIAVDTTESDPRPNSGGMACIPWITVIIPAYRGEQWIVTALDSLVAEAVDGIEVLVIDGSPTSDTRDIARRYADRLRLRVYERSDLTSWQSKTNFGVSLAKSNHICWLGVDDLWLRGRAATVKRWIEAAPNATLHIGASVIIDQKGRKLGVWRCPLPAEVEIGSALVSERLLVQNFVAAPAPVFRRDAWQRCGGLDERLWYTADWDIWLKLAAIGPIYYHGDATVGFRIHKSSLTATGSRDTDDFVLQLRLVLDRHIANIDGVSKEVERVARASIVVNAALASASIGRFGDLLHASAEIVRLGPAGMRRYFRDSRIMDRLIPRVRAKLTGVF